MKFGAFVACKQCGKTPRTDDDLIMSLAMTEHYFKIDTMQQMGQAIKDGRPPHLDEATRKNLLDNLVQFKKTPVGNFLGGSARQEKKKLKWWPF
jgi:hypothetical protein